MLLRMTQLEAYRQSPPWWYGLAWREPDRAVLVLAPIPLNHLIAWSRRFYWMVKTNVTTSPLERAFDRGYELGRQHAQEHYERTRDRDAEERAFERLLHEIRRVG
jgi:hypothetical protein